MPQNQPKQSLQGRLLQEAARLDAIAGALPIGPERDAITRRARHAETASQFDKWLSSPIWRHRSDQRG